MPEEKRNDSIWQFWIDVGGTFTDCLARSPTGHEHRTKVLSSGLTKGSIDRWLTNRELVSKGRSEDGEQFWNGAAICLRDQAGTALGTFQVDSYNDTGCFSLSEQVPDSVRDQAVVFELDHSVHAPILAIRRILKLNPVSELPECRMHLGTTRGTNALLTRRGARTALVTSIGFRDLLCIGDQARPHLFELAVKKPDVLFETSVELNERTLVDGTVELAPQEDEVKRVLLELRKAGIRSIAVCLIHGYRYPGNEQKVGAFAREMGFDDVRLSHEVAPLIKMVNRGETTVLDAYLNPVIGTYLDEIQLQLSAKGQMRLMTSYGGLVPRSRFSGKDSVLSGPAGGVVGAARVAQSAGFEKAITFDMGGTSTDVGRFDGEFELEYETRKAGVRIVSPMMAIETVAAGGGSICRFDGAKLTVGPESATSDPGPACYGNGGPLTVTDLNLFLGRLVPSQFPFELSLPSVRNRLNEILDEMKLAGFDLSLTDLATGFLQIANHNMAAAIRCVSVANGYDPQEYVLVSFGGAGSQHCCSVADSLSISRILDHPLGSILSAVGIHLADQTATRVRSVLCLLNEETRQQTQSLFSEMQAEIQAELRPEVAASAQIEIQLALDLRYAGTDSYETIPFSETSFEESFSDVHQQRYGYTKNQAIEVVAARATGRVRGNRLAPSSLPSRTEFKNSDWRQQVVVPMEAFGSELYQELPIEVFDRNQLVEGDMIAGPAIIANELTSTIVDPGWTATQLSDGQLLLEKSVLEREGESNNPTQRSQREADDESNADPIELEIFNNHFSMIARQMGITLQKTSTSVNVKERLDFSCAVFSNEGRLVVNAPHIPVHLGAMSQTVRAAIEDNPVVSRGDVFVTNDPYRGGSHLPDVTVITPVFCADFASPSFWVASRSHHAEIGGKSPGSMPADATCLAEEGVLISNFKLIDAGQDRFDQLREILAGGPYPSRMPDENIADIAAQVAANRKGELDLLELVRAKGLKKVHAYMRHIQDAAERKARSALRELPDGQFSFEDSMDNGATIRVRIDKRDDDLEIDFAGTDPVVCGNLNANSAIVSAAVMYVMRLLISEDIPLNEGVMEPVRIILPECFLNPTPAADPAESPAIVGGNVETSQRVVDVLLGALGLAAASSGTMNNWLMGDDSFGYYETVGGGSGATENCSGADAVHTHMTNTRLTDPEILETRYPVRLRDFSIRTDSGGQGSTNGGSGIRREVEFTKALTVSLLTSRRSTQPFGLKGGEPGMSGQNGLLRNGTDEVVILDSQCEANVAAGDRLILLTPGGGGFGSRSLNSE